jgi:hypothetical protein
MVDSVGSNTSIGETCDHVTSGSCIRQNFGSARLVRILQDIKHKRDDGEKLGIKGKPVWSHKHWLLLNLHPDVDDISRNGNSSRSTSVTPLINFFSGRKPGRGIVQKWSVQHHLDVSIRKS